MAAIWPAATAAALDLLTAVNNTKVTLTVDAAVGDTTLTVDDASQLPASGYLTFDDNATNPETIFYTGRTTSNLTGVTRGADGTAAASHSSAGSNTHIEQRWNAAYHTVHSTEIIAIETDLTTRIGHDAGSHQILSQNGTVSLPQYSFAGDADAGLYWIGADDIAISTNGTKALEVNATQQIVIPKTSNQLIIGTTNTVTISSTAPSASRTYTIPDAGGAASFVMTAGTQTISGATTFSATVTMSGATIAMGSQKITGLAAATTAGDALRYEQLFTSSTVTMLGNLAFTSASFGVVGITSGSQAASGNVGQVVSSSVLSASAVSLTTANTPVQITSITLGAGNWVICCMAVWTANTVTLSATNPYFDVYISTTTASSAGTTYGVNSSEVIPSTAATPSTTPVAMVAGYAVSINGSTTYYMNAASGSTYSSGFPKAYGSITAIRIS